MQAKSKIHARLTGSLKSKIQNLLPWLAVLLVIIGQFYYLPERLNFLHQTLTFAQITDPRETAQIAYGAADYDLLAWVERETAPDTTLLLVTANPRTYGDPSYLLYHRAMYHLYPRNVWWAAPVPPTRYPAWWIFSDLSEADILDIAQSHQATAILADGFTHPPVTGASIAFDTDTFLIFPAGQVSSSMITGSFPALPDPLLPQQSSEAGPVQGQFFSLSNHVWAYLQTLLALSTLWLWGDALYSFSRERWVSPSLPRRLAVGWLLGCGITSLGTFILLWAGISLAAAVTSLSISGCLLWLVTHLKRYLDPPAPPPSAEHPAVPRPPTPLTLLFAPIIAIQVGLVAFAAWASPLTDWDAWVNWAGKANAIFIDQTLSPNMFHNPARLPTNMDYPLMLPLVEAWFYTWLGQIYEPVIGFISVLFYGALLLLFYNAARCIVSSVAALGFTTLLATIPRLERPAHTGLADIPLAALVFLSFLLLLEILTQPPRENQSPPLPCSPTPLLLLALSTSLLPWLKNEGWLWWSLVSLSLLVGLVLKVKRKQLSTGQALISFLTYLIPALTIPLLWQSFLTIFGTYRFTFLPLTLANFWTNLPRLPVIGWHMLTRLLNPYWNFVWLLAGLTLVIRRQRILFAPLGWLMLPLGGYLALVSLTYVFSRFDPFLAHLNNSAERLSLQAAPLALWWLLGQSVALGWVSEKSEELKETDETGGSKVPLVP